MIGTDIYMAGGEIEKLTRSLLDNGVRWILYSYYYILRFSKEGFVDRMKREYPGVQWFLDSGAFTYATFAATGNRKIPPVDKYVQLYMDYVADAGEGFSRVTELDLDGIETLDIPYEQVQEWLEEMLVRFPHLPVMPTFHGWRGEAEWDRYCNDPRIKCMAIGRGTNNLGLQRRLVMKAMAKGKPVHGFAMTKFKSTLQLVPYDSVDSTSWVMGQKYGLTYIFFANQWKVLTGDQKAQRRRFRQYFTSIGVDYHKIEADDLDELRKANVIAWRNLSLRYHEMKMRRDHVMPVNQPVTVDEADIVVSAPPTPAVRRPRSLPRDAAAVPASTVRQRPMGMFGVPIQDPTRQRAKARE